MFCFFFFFSLSLVSFYQIVFIYYCIYFIWKIKTHFSFVSFVFRKSMKKKKFFARKTDSILSFQSIMFHRIEFLAVVFVIICVRFDDN